MLRSPKFDVKRVGHQGLNINSFLKPQDGGIDSYEFTLTGFADQKFLTKLSKLVKSENKDNDESDQTTEPHK